MYLWSRHGNDLLDTTPNAPSVKEIMDKLDFIKMKNFCSAKENEKTSGGRRGPPLLSWHWQPGAAKEAGLGVFCWGSPADGTGF